MDDHVPKPQNNFAFGRTSHKQKRHKTPCSLAGCGAQALRTGVGGGGSAFVLSARGGAVRGIGR